MIARRRRREETRDETGALRVTIDLAGPDGNVPIVYLSHDASEADRQFVVDWLATLRGKP